MQNFIKSLLVVLSASILFSLAGTESAKAQTPPNAKSFKAIMSKLVRQKNNNQPFVIITPEDLSKLSAEEMEIIAGGDPCETATPISINQNVNGQLTSGDCRLDDGSYADFYTFNGASGQNITVAMNSTAFDTYLGLANSTGTFILEDDNGGGGTNSRINTVLPETGLYIILANSVSANQFGGYNLTLTAFAACTYSINPTSATIASEGGTYSFTINTQFGCQWAASVPGASFLSTNSTGTGTGTVVYTAAPNGFNGTRTDTITVGGRVFTVTQPPINCAFSLNPTSVTVPASGGEYTFAVNTQVGCYWSATYNGYFISTNSYGTGPGTVTYSISTNNVADRTGTITVGGQVFTITQPGLNCTYSVSPLNISIDRFENYGSVDITTQPGCTWSTFGASPWIIILSPLAGTGSGTVYFRTYVNPYEMPRAGVIPIYGTSYIRVNVLQGGSLTRARFDFDQDGKSDVAVYRPSNGVWYLNQSNNGFSAYQFGTATDKVVPADYDGDGRTDIAVFRDGTWYIQRSQLGFLAVSFGQTGDIPMPRDYDLNGTDDIAVYRPSNGTWYVYNLINNNLMFSPIAFGAAGDKPVMGDFDGDSRNDLAVYRPSTGNWYVLQLRDFAITGMRFGSAEDIPVPADYDGDGRTDYAVFRPSNGTWYIQQSRDGFINIYFGQTGDLPTPADYDGDRKADIAVFRQGTWYMNRSTAGFTGVSFGTNTDIPLANVYLY